MNREAVNLHIWRMETDKAYKRRFTLYAQQAASKFRIPAARILFGELTNADPFYWCARRAFKEEWQEWQEWCAQGVPVERQYNVRRAPDTHGISRIEYLPSVNRKHAKRPYRNEPIGEAAYVVPTAPEWNAERIARILVDTIDERNARAWYLLDTEGRFRLIAARECTARKQERMQDIQVSATEGEVERYLRAHFQDIGELVWKIHLKLSVRFGLVSM